jgi:hypothetical protein
MERAGIYLWSWAPTAVVIMIWIIPIAFAIWVFRSLKRIENKLDAIQRRMGSL